MKTAKADIRISVRRGDDVTRKIELFAHLLPGRYTVKVDGVKPEKVSTTTVTEVMHKLREWLSAPTKRSSK